MRMLERFGEARIAVIGDLLADLYVTARPVGLSREAPVMVLNQEDQWISPGGAANAISNLLSLSGAAEGVGVVGDDEAGRMLMASLAERGFTSEGIVTASGSRTFTKMRVFAGDLHTVKQQVMRLDSNPDSRMSQSVEASVLRAIDSCSNHTDAWLISDYDGDLFVDAVIDRLGREAAGKLVVVDSHARLDRFKGVACITPNEAEAEAASLIEITDDKSARMAALRLLEITQARHIFMTRGNRGMMIAGSDGSFHSMGIVGPREIVDVAGAGDTVAAVVTICLANGVDALTAGILAAYAASVVCMKTGVAPATVREVAEAVEKYPLPELISRED